MKHILSLILVLQVFALSGCQNTELVLSSQELPAHHLEDGTFTNPHLGPVDKTIFSFLKMRFFGDTPFSDQASEAHLVPVSEDLKDIKTAPGSKPVVTWLGHSSFLIQHAGNNILMDPILSDRASPVPFAGPRRLVSKPFDVEDLPLIDLVIISHSHYDHLDEATVSALNEADQGRETRYLVPLKLGQWFEALGVPPHRIVEFDWWDKKHIESVTVTATPSQHWSARGLFDRNQTLWASWHLDIAGFSVWFGGDTGYNEIQFKEIGKRLGPVDLGLIPIGAYAPRWFMGPQHIDPTEALKIHQEIQAKRSIGMHWGTFQLTAEPIMEPKVRLEREAKALGMDPDEFLTLAIGESYQY